MAALAAALAVAVVPEVRVGVCYERWATPPSPSKRRVRPLWGGPVVCVWGRTVYQRRVICLYLSAGCMCTQAVVGLVLVA